MRAIGGLLVVVVTAAAGTAAAQVGDHLRCFRIKDPLAVRALVDLDAGARAAYDAAGCRLSSARQYCVAVTPTSIEPPPAGTPQPGTPIANDLICYKLRCPDGPPPATVTDAFGTRTLRRLTTSFLCVPAREVPATTTTTTSTSTLPTTTMPQLPPCTGTVQVDPLNTVTALTPGQPTEIPVAITIISGFMDVVLGDGGIGGTTLCPSVCSFISQSGTVSLIYTPPDPAPATIVLTATLSPHSFGFTCGEGSASATASKSFPVTP